MSTDKDKLPWSLEHCHALLATLPDHILVLDEQLKIRYVNHPSPGLSVEQLLGVSLPTLVEPERQAEIRGILEGVLATGVPASYETVYPTPAGEVIHYESRVSLLRGEGGTVGLVLDARDITGRIETEQALALKERMYREVFDASEDAILILDGDTFVDCNAATVSMLGAPDKDWVLATHPWDLSPLYQPDGRVSTDKAQEMIRLAHQNSFHRFEWVHRRENGEEFPVEVTLTKTQLQGHDVLHVVWNDISDRKRLELERAQLQRQLVHTQKMEALGRLTGGIAHDFNNMLATAQGYTELAQMRAEQAGDDKQQGYLAEVLKTTERASGLVRQMLLFARGGQAEPSLQQLSELVSESISMMRPVLPSSMELVTRVEADVPPVLVDPVQLHQVLLNLCINARDAMEGKGRIEIGVRSVVARGECSSCHEVLDGEYVELLVRDNGPGIAHYLLSRIFDPFFTSKELGGGSGMGLSMVHGIVHEHGGHIQVDSRPGQGAAFHVLLPPASEGG
jgi:PAS domain S-box-containing protein